MPLTSSHKELIKDKIHSIVDLGDECWRDLEPHIALKHIDKNEHYSKEGQFTKDIGFVIEGVLRIYYLNEKGEEWTKHFLMTNDFFAASIDPDKQSVTNIQALTKVAYISIPYWQLQSLATKHKQIRQFLQKITNQYLASKEEREIILLSQDAKEKYLHFRDKFPGLENTIPHYHIASYLGVTPTQLSRIRKKL